MRRYPYAKYSRGGRVNNPCFWSADRDETLPNHDKLSQRLIAIRPWDLCEEPVPEVEWTERCMDCNRLLRRVGAQLWCPWHDIAPGPSRRREYAQQGPGAPE